MRQQVSARIRPRVPESSFPLVCLYLIPPTPISPVPSKSILLRLISLKQDLPTTYQIKSELFGLAFWHFHKWILVYHSSPMSQAPILDPRWAHA